MQQFLQVLESLELGKRLLPKNNPDISWFYVFIPAFLGYFVLLSNHLNTKPIGGYIERINLEKMNKIFSINAKIEIIHQENGSSWNEGPIWVTDEDATGYLLYSNTKQNKIYKWEEGKGLFSIGRTVYYNKSGCYSNFTHCSTFSEVGSNGLIQLPKFYLDAKTPKVTDILVCQHGERAVSLFKENGTRYPIATHYRGRRFNSPNDIIFSPEGHIYFTDPPYGLYHKESLKIQSRELPFSGIYYINSTSLLHSIRTGIPTTGTKLVHKDMNRPNGLAFSPDFSKLYVSNSDSKNSYLRTFYVQENGKIINFITLTYHFVNHDSIIINSVGNLKIGEVLYNFTIHQEEGSRADQGNPDGIKVDIFGNIFVTGNIT
jgi:gluconolactonase